MRWLCLLPVLILAACSGGDGGNAAAPVVAGSAGERLESAAMGQGLVADAAATLAGAWARDTDRACIVEDAGGRQRIGLVSDYGDGQGCSGAGVMERRGERLRVAIGACRFVARYDGERISLPGALPAACDTLCRGRASLSGFTVERQSGSASEAATLRGRRGRMLCG